MPLAAELADLQGALHEAAGEYAAGRAEDLRTTFAYGAHPLLMRAEEVAELRPRADDPQVRPLFAHLVRAQIAGGCAPGLDRIRMELHGERLKGLEDKWFFADTRERITAECNRKQRKLLDQAWRRALARHEPDYLKVLEQSHTLMVDRGFTGYTAMCQALYGVDVAALLEEADGLAEDSAGTFGALMAEPLRAAGVFPEDARYHDMVYLWGGAWGPARGIPDAAELVGATFRELGLALDAIPGLTADLGAREGKLPGVTVAAVRVPQDVRLIARPEATWIAPVEWLSGAAVAVGLAHAPADEPSKALIDPAVRACWQAVFASLYGNPEWIRRHLPKTEAQPQTRLFHLWWLYEVRRLHGMAGFARYLHGPGEPMDKADAFEHYLHKATGARFERDHYLADTRWFLEDLFTLRGHFLAAQILTGLEEEFGTAWFADPGAATRLRALWGAGWHRFEALAEAAGIDEPDDIWPLTERLEAVLGEFEEDDA